MDVKVRRAKVSDALHFERIVGSVFLDDPKDAKNMRNGFLMGNKGREKYAELISKSRHCFVAVVDKKVVGFLLAYPRSLISPYAKKKLMREMLKMYRCDFVYIDQIAIVPEYQGKGIGKKLYTSFFKTAKGIKKTMHTSARPRNWNSERFHLGLGFRKVWKTKDVKCDSFLYERD